MATPEHQESLPSERDARSASTPSALPSKWRRALAFLAIVVGGACGAMIGYGFADLSCSASCETTLGAYTLLGAIIGAGGVAVVAILTLRAMDEWESIGASKQPRRNGPQRGGGQRGK